MTKRWKPKTGKRYFALAADATVAENTWRDDWCDRSLHSSGNCFRTEAEAELASKKFKELLLSLHEPTTDCDQLPKLTAEVFDRLDCPEWAKYAAVNSKGTLIFFGNKPTFEGEDYGCWSCSGYQYKHIRNIVFDASDWENSLIELQSKLPDWCKVNATGWCERYGYFKVTNIDEYSEGVYVQRVDDKSTRYLPFRTVYSEVVHAQPRPYNEAEMVKLVGKTITMPDGAVCLCTAYSKRFKSVIFDNIHWDAQKLMDSGCTIDGNPCCVFERLENGK